MASSALRETCGEARTFSEFDELYASAQKAAPMVDTIETSFREAL